MKRLQDICRLSAILCGLTFVWGIGTEVDLLPHLIASDWLRWQVTLVTGIFLWVVSERLADLRCRCCGSDDVLVRALVSTSHELLCRRCLSWNPSTSSGPAVPLLPSERLARSQGGFWRALLAGDPVRLRVRWGSHTAGNRRAPVGNVLHINDGPAAPVSVR
jgi:hypothetical protein